MKSQGKSVARDSFQMLLHDGVLLAGDQLIWKRRAEVFRATVLESGLIMTSDGMKHRTPSGAAKHLIARSVDGWLVWRCERLNKTLNELRRPL
jgi:hypothetical protein